MTAILLHNIHSTIKPETVYGRQYEPVTVTAEFGDVKIVAGPDGNRFPVHVSRIGMLSDADHGQLKVALSTIARLESEKKTPATIAGIKTNQNKVNSILDGVDKVVSC